MTLVVEGGWPTNVTREPPPPWSRRAASRLRADPIVQPIYGLIASDERRAASGRRGDRRAAVPRGRLGLSGLRRLPPSLCVDLAVMPDRSGRPTLTCKAAEALLPVGPAAHAGPHRRGAHQQRARPHSRGEERRSDHGQDHRWHEASWLTVEDSGIVGRARPSRRGTA